MSIQFVGRERELQKLNDLYATDNFQMAVIYGRRRVGIHRSFVDEPE